MRSSVTYSSEQCLEFPFIIESDKKENQSAQYLGCCCSVGEREEEIIIHGLRQHFKAIELSSNRVPGYHSYNGVGRNHQMYR